MFNKKGIFRSKKAGEKVLSIWWFFVLALIGLGTIGAVVMYYSAEVDVKGIEAGILADRVADCIIQRGYISSDFLVQGSSFNLFKNCKISEKIIKSNNNLYISILAYDLFSYENDGKAKEIESLSFSAGATTIPENCNIKESVREAKHFPRCSEKSFIALNRYDKTIPNRIVFKILAGSNQDGGILI